MSEKSPAPILAEHLNNVEQTITSNGAKRIYGVVEVEGNNGTIIEKRHALSVDRILHNFGYEDEQSLADYNKEHPKSNLNSRQQVTVDRLTNKQDRSLDRLSDIDTALSTTEYQQSFGMVRWLAAKTERFVRGRMVDVRQKRIDRLEGKAFPPVASVEVSEEVQHKEGRLNRIISGLRRKDTNYEIRDHTDFTDNAGELDVHGWMSAAREDIAMLNARSRYASFGKKKQLQEAQENYQQAFSMFMASEMLELQEQEGVEFNAEEFKVAALEISIEEIRDRTSLEAEYFAQSSRGKVLLWYKNLSRPKKLLVGGGLGLATGALGMVGGAGTLLVGGGLIRFNRSKLTRQANGLNKAQASAEFREGMEAYYLESNLQESDLMIDETASPQENNDRRAEVVAGTLLGGSRALEKHDKRQNRTAVLTGVAALVGGYAIGKALSGLEFVKNTSHTVKTPHTGSLPSGNLIEDLGPNNSTGSAVKSGIETFSDHVGRGDGITKSIIDFAGQHGQDELDPRVAFRIFNKAKDNGLMTNQHISNIGPMNVQGGLGFISPGNTTFSPELVQFLKDELVEKAT